MRQKETRPTPEPEPADGESERPLPPEGLKPWYYQYWFLYPSIIFWPLWSVLIVRSPWHNGLVSGALAWCLLIVGGYLVYQRMALGGTVALSTVGIVLPGLALTIITQTHWLLNRRRILAAARTGTASSGAEADAAATVRGRRQRRRSYRRGRRR